MKKSTGNLKIHWDKWKLKDNLPKSTGVPKSVLRVKFIETQAYFIKNKNLKKKKKKQNLILKKIRKRGTNKAQKQNRQQQQKKKNRNRKDNETKT